MSSVLRVDTLQTPQGDPVMTFLPGGSIDFAGGLAPSNLKIPVWTTETRPASPEIGFVGFNTDEKQLEIYTGADLEWITIGGASTANDWNNVITDGLILHLDALNPASYNGAGSSWYDFSGSGFTAVMNGLSSSNWVDVDGTKAFETNDSSAQRFIVSSFTPPQSGRTVEVWIKSKSFSIGWQTWVDDNNERILFGTSSNSVQIYPDLNFTANLQTNTWYHLAYTLDGPVTTTCKAYVNGSLLNSGNYASTLRSGAGDLWIYGDAGSETTSLYGSIVRYYNRPLSASEISANYNAQKARFGY